MIKAVLDTNVLISSLFWKGNPRHIVDLAIAGKIKSITSPEILEELDAVLYEDFKDIPYAKIEEIIRDTLSYSQLVIPSPAKVKQLRDLKDVKIISCALSSKADYIVTGDKDLLVLKKCEQIHIVTPSAFLDLLK